MNLIQDFIADARERFSPMPLAAHPVLPLDGLEDVTEATLLRDELRAARQVILGLQAENLSLKDDLRQSQAREAEAVKKLLIAQNDLHDIHDRADMALHRVMQHG